MPVYIELIGFVQLCLLFRHEQYQSFLVPVPVRKKISSRSRSLQKIFWWRSYNLKKRYSRIPAKISSRTFGNPKMVFEGKKKVSEHSGNPLRVSDSNKLRNRKEFSRLGNAWKGFFSFGNSSRFPSLLLSETLRGFPECSETFFCPRKPFLGFRMFGNLFWPVFENTLF